MIPSFPLALPLRRRCLNLAGTRHNAEPFIHHHDYEIRHADSALFGSGTNARYPVRRDSQIESVTSSALVHQ
jgi:hypothetical protein